MKKLLFLLTILSFQFLNAQDTVKVLFIGNSFLSQNNLPELFKNISIGAGKKVYIESHMPGGVSVGDISQGTSAHMNNPTVYSLIKNNNWDYLVLQDNQGRFCLGYGQFPTSSLVIEGHEKIRDSLIFYNPCAKMIWFAGFATKGGIPPYGNTGAALIDTIYRNYKFLFDSLGQIIAPIGPSFLRIINDYPSINLWSSDDTHPSLHGSYLAANVIYTTIFKSSPLKSSYNPGLIPNEDSLLKKISYQTTIDSISKTGLSNITPQINQSCCNFVISNYSNCQWFFNGVALNNQNCYLDNLSKGIYYAITTDSNNCKYITLEINYNPSNINENLLEQSIKIFPNPSTNFVNIEIENNIKQKIEFEIYNQLGKLLIYNKMDNNKSIVNIENLQNGIYLIRFKIDNHYFTKKLQINK